MTNSIVTTKFGDITGIRNDVCVIYRGIPYATAKRFEAPVPVEPWGKPLEAFGPDIDCPQFSTYRTPVRPDDDFYGKEFYSEYDYEYAENPLTLNIITPLSPVNCPVIVFIHGGGFETGKVGDLPYGDTDEYAKRNAILVNIEYRLNVFSLYKCGNYGLLDQIAAIKWVKENISSFGGDNEKIIIMGQSAGAMSIMDLCYSQQLKGMVKGAVTMSGGGMVPFFGGPWTKEKAEPFWNEIRRICGAETDEELKTVDPELLWNTWYDYSRENYSMHGVVPGIDGSVIPDKPQELRKKNKILDIPMIIGMTSQDFIAPVLAEMAISWAKDAYRKGRKPVYLYFFDRTLPGNLFKAFHAADLWYMFGNMKKSWRPFEEKDYILSARMIDYVVQFAKTGEPGDWKPFTPKNRLFRLFDGENDGYVKPGTVRRKAWYTLLKDKGPM